MGYNWPQLLWAGAQGLSNLGQQQQALQYNQQALADSLGLQGDLYGRIMGAPGYVPQALGYGSNPYLPTQGQSQFVSPTNAPGQAGGGGPAPDLLSWLAGPQSIWGQAFPNLAYQSPQPGAAGGPEAEMLAPGTRMGKTAIPVEGGGFLPDYPGNLQPQYQSLPDLTAAINQGYANRAQTGQLGAEELQSRLRQGYLGAGNDVRRMVNQARANVGEGYGGLGADIGAQTAALTGNVLGGYGERFNRNIDRLTGLGAREAADIQENYRQLGASENARLASLGLGGTTVGSTQALGRQREMTRDLGDLGERLRREITGYDVALSGDTLAAQERLGNLGIGRQMDIGLQGLGADVGLLGQGVGARTSLLHQGLASQADLGRFGLGFGAGLTGDQLAQQYAGGQNLYATDIGLTRGLTGTLESVNYPYPQGGFFDPLQQYFAMRASQPSGGGNEWLAPSILGGAQLGGAFLGALPFNGMNTWGTWPSGNVMYPENVFGTAVKQSQLSGNLSPFQLQ